MIFWVFNNKKNKILRRLNLLIMLNSETLSSYLTPILAQYNIKYLDFINVFVHEFSKKTKEIYPELFNPFFQKDSKYLSYENLTIKVYVIFDIFGKYTLEFVNPTINMICKYFLNYNYFFNIRKKYFYFFCYKLSFFFCYINNVGYQNTKKIEYFKMIYNYLSCIFNFLVKKKRYINNSILFHSNFYKNYNEILKNYNKKYLFQNKNNFFIFYSIFSLKYYKKLDDIFNVFNIKKIHFFSNIFIGIIKNIEDLKNLLNYYITFFFNTKLLIRNCFFNNNFCSIIFLKNNFFSSINILNILLWFNYCLILMIIYNIYVNYQLFYFK